MNVEYEIHLGVQNRVDPDTGKELPPGVIAHKEWTPALEKLRQQRPGKKVFFIERHLNPDGTPKTMDDGTVIESGCHVPLFRAKEMMAEGLPDMTQQAAAIVRSIEPDGETESKPTVRKKVTKKAKK